MRRNLLAAAAIFAVSALSAATPAKADPYHLIRWSDTGFCQIWDNGIPDTPWPGNFTVVSHTVPNFLAALALKDHMLHHGHCSF
jgi:hypothetical protein